MTPAAPHLERFIPKAKFRRIHRRSFGSEATKAKKSSKLKTDHRKMLSTSYSNVESCDEEDISPKRKRFSPINHRFATTPSTSKKTHCDNHVEFSDEDAEDIPHTSYGRKCNKSGFGSTKEGNNSKTESSSAEENANNTGVNDLLTKHGYYIVQNDGKPAEMFRTDLVDRLRKGVDAHIDSDDEDIPGSGLARMTDRWRTEWSYGTQVPLQPDCPTVNEVRKTTVRCQPSSHSTQQRKALMKNFLSKPYAEFPRDPLRLYESTRLDEHWLILINKKRTDMHCPALTMGTLLTVMNAFEIECYKNVHKKLLEPLHSPSSRIGEYDEEAPCDICRACESEPDDEMVFCDGCNLCVHMSCYGLQLLPPGEWLCMKCRYCFGRNPPCVLCPTIGGALKLTDKNQWAHVVCALWIHECRFGDIEKREPITCIDEIDEERWRAKCSVCDTRQGACIKCSVSSCKTFFHVTCALRSGLEMRIEQDTDDDKVHMISLCQRHRSAKIFDDGASSGSNQQCGSDEETEGQASSGMLGHLEQICYQFVDYREIAERLSLDHLCVSDVFEYWKWRRLSNNGKPLIDNLQDEITIDEPEQLQLELPEFVEGGYGTQLTGKRGRGRPKKGAAEGKDVKPPPQAPYTPKRMTRAVRSWVRLCNSLHKGHDLLGLVLRKTKEERNYLHICGSAATLIAEHISRPVPFSERTMAYLNESIERLYTEDVLNEGEARADELCHCSEQPTPSETPSLPRASCVSSTQSSPSTSSSSESYHPTESRSPTPIPNKSYHTRATETAANTSVSSTRIKATAINKGVSPPDNPEEQRRVRKGSLRSADVKEETECVTKAHDTSRRIRSASPTSRNTASHDRSSGPFKEHIAKGVRSDNPRSVSRHHLDSSSSSNRAVLSPEAERSSVNDTDSTEAKPTPTEDKPELRRRLRSSTDTSSTTLKVLKNLKNRSKDITASLRDITQAKDDVKSEPRTLRSRASLPPMFQVSRVNGKRVALPLKSVSGFGRSHAKRRSDVELNASARTIFAH